MSESLTEHITAILEDHETPDSLRSALIDALFELAHQAQVNLDTPEVLHTALPLILEKLREQAEQPLSATPNSTAATTEE